MDNFNKEIVTAASARARARVRARVRAKRGLGVYPVS